MCPIQAVAAAYNNGAHWWADLLSSRHFKDSGQHASYRYDGLESDGQLRYAALDELTLTSDSRHISLVFYRQKPDASSTS